MGDTPGNKPTADCAGGKPLSSPTERNRSVTPLFT